LCIFATVSGVNLRASGWCSYLVVASIVVSWNHRALKRALDQRMLLHNAVLKHRAEGMSYNAIIRAVEEEFHVRLSKSHLSNWIRGDHVPDGSVREFNSTPTTPLGYVTGAMLGDGSACEVGDHNYRLRLSVTDKDFAEAFAQAIGSVLGIPSPNVKFLPERTAWYVEVSSKLLCEFLGQPVVQTEKAILSSKACASGFLMGFFDSEGSVYGRSLSASNGDVDLLALVTSHSTSSRLSLPDRFFAKKLAATF